MASTPPPGHQLLHGGSALDDERLPTGLKEGPAACECGELSEELPSNGARRAWHRAHVSEVRAELEADLLGDDYA